MEWIKCEDRLPDFLGMCIIYGRFYKDTPYTSYFACYIPDKLIFKSHDQIMDNVTHWQPFPEPPHQPKLVWQRSTKAMPDIWITSTDEEHERGQHLTKFLWRRKEM